MKAAILIFVFLIATTNSNGQRVPDGKLGHPLGTWLTIEGIRADGIKTGVQTLLVDTINGKKLSEPIRVWIDNVDSLPEKDRCILRGYEDGKLIGVPPAWEEEARAAGKVILLPQAAWQFMRYFVVTSVIGPNTLKAKIPKMWQ